MLSPLNGKAPLFKTVLYKKAICKMIKHIGFKYFTCHLRDFIPWIFYKVKDAEVLK